MSEAVLIYKQRWFKWCAASLLLLLIFISLLPIAVRHIIVQQLQEQGFQQAAITDVDINLFTGEVGLKGVNVSGDGQARATLTEFYVNLAMQSLWHKRIELQQLRVIGLDVKIVQDDQGRVQIAGWSLPQTDASAEPVADEENTPWGIGIQALQLQQLQVEARLPDLELDLILDNFKLGMARSWQADQSAPLDARLNINGAPLLLSGDIKPFAEKVHSRFELKLSQLPLAMIRNIASSQGVDGLDGHLSIALQVDAMLDGEISIESQIQLEDLALQQTNYDLALAALDWQGSVHYQPSQDEQTHEVSVNGNLGLQQLQVKDLQAEVTLLSAQQLFFKQFELQPDLHASLAGIELKQLAVVSEQELLSLKAVQLQQLKYDGATTVAMQKLALQGMLAQITLTESGEVKQLQSLMTEQSSEASAASITEPEDNQVATESEAAAPWRVQLAQFSLGDGSRVVFEDHSVEPAFKADIQPLELIAKDIDSGNIEQDISLMLSTKINELTQLTVDAKVRPFGDKLDLNAEGELKHLDMPPLSPYALKAMGYYLKRGQANATFTALVEQDQLDTQINLKLNKLNIEAGDPEQVKSMNDKLAMPLDLALNILRDGDDNIELKLAVDGDISDPQFDPSGIINKALANGTKMAAVGVLKNALQPWGAVFSVVSFLGKKVTTPIFDPVMFVAGTTELQTEQDLYLEKMAALLSERPELELNICAMASEQDRQALLPPTPEPQAQEGEQTASVEAEPQAAAEQGEVTGSAPAAEPAVSNQVLIELAQQRIGLVRQLLIDQGVDTGRLYGCQPTMEYATEAGATVELFL